jgi:hypothetical protein
MAVRLRQNTAAVDERVFCAGTTRLVILFQGSNEFKCNFRVISNNAVILTPHSIFTPYVFRGLSPFSPELNVHGRAAQFRRSAAFTRCSTSSWSHAGMAASLLAARHHPLL